MVEQQKQREPGSWEKWEAIFRRQRGSCCAGSPPKSSPVEVANTSSPVSDPATESDSEDEE